MKQNRWKKIIGIILLIGVLVLSFWYGGNAPGLQGFSVNSDVSDNTTNAVGADVDNERTVEKDNGDRDNTHKTELDEGNIITDEKDYPERTTNQNANQDNNKQNARESKKEKKSGLLGQIMMKIKKIGSSNKSKKNNPQLSKRAQKNANRAADKSIKKNKKKAAQNNKSNKTDNSNKRDNSNTSDSNSKSENSAANGNNKSDNNASDGNNIDKAQQDSKGESKTTDDASDSRKADSADAKEGKGDNTPKSFADYEDTGNNDTDDKNRVDGSTKDNGDYLTCTIYISCASVLNHMDKLSDAAKKVVPDDGVILNLTTVKVKKDATVFDVLQKAARDNKVHLEYNFTPAYKTYYIEGIGNLYQFDAGNLSGWLYSVNDEFPGVGCSSCKVKDGDCIKWVYTCNFGKDVGGYVFDE